MGTDYSMNDQRPIGLFAKDEISWLKVQVGRVHMDLIPFDNGGNHRATIGANNKSRSSILGLLSELFNDLIHKLAYIHCKFYDFSMEKSANFITREVLEHTLLIPLNAIDGGEFLRLNESGSYLWRNLENFASAEQMIQALENRYQIQRGQAEQGVADFLAALKQFQVIQ